MGFCSLWWAESREKGDLAIDKGDQTMIGDSHAVGVAAEILQHIVRATEGTFQVHHPVLSKQWPEPSSEILGSERSLHFSGKRSSPLEGLPEGCDELATKDPTQYRFGQEVVVRRVDPASVIE